MTTHSDTRERLDLSGSWQLVFDPRCEGLGQEWTSGTWPETRANTVDVPAIWNISHPDADGVGFYRRRFKAPATMHDKVVLLHCEGASYRTEAWLNSCYLGSHEGAYTPFWFDISSFIHAGDENELIMRVAALSRKQAVDGMTLAQMPASKQSWYYAYGGLWGKVYLEALPHVACQSLWVDPDLRGEKVQAYIVVNNRQMESSPVDMHLEVHAPDGAVVTAYTVRTQVSPGAATLSCTLSIPRPLPWSCQYPNLYHLQVEIWAGGAIDRQRITFGMRDFTVQNGQFFLNGEPIFLRGCSCSPITQ